MLRILVTPDQPYVPETLVTPDQAYIPETLVTPDQANNLSGYSRQTT